MNQNVILHIDMNSYFAAVEQQANPFLRGRAVGVCAYLSAKGCIIASSKEAKEVGIKTGCRVYEALKLYPEVVLVQNDPAKYRAVTKKIFSILAEYTEEIEPYSIDEAFLDLSGAAFKFSSKIGRVESLKDGQKLGVEIKERIAVEIGEWLTCSIGVAQTRFWAKLLSDTTDKNSVVYIDPANYKSYLAKLKLTDIWGINYRLQERFNRLGIRTPLEIVEARTSKILHNFGKYGYFLQQNLAGSGIDRIKTEEELAPKSIGHSYMLPKKTRDKTSGF